MRYMIGQQANGGRSHTVENNDDASLCLDCVSRNIQRAGSEGGDLGQKRNVTPAQIALQNTTTLRAVFDHV